MESKNICVIGTGYVGLISAVCFAYFGHDVLALDIDKRKISKLKKGYSPIHEPGLDKLLKQVLETGKLQFVSDYKKAVKFGEFIFIAVGTPPKKDGSANLSFVSSAYEEIARFITDKDKKKIIVNKSTVPVGTGRWAKQLLLNKIKRYGIKHPEKVCEVVSNPEFLREGKAIYDFMNPDRVVIGCDNRDAAWKVAALYEKLNPTLIITDISTAEMIKYAANSFLATKISFINEIANVCEKLGADVDMVAKGIGLDRRISPYFFQAGLGFGGSCFPKDLSALISVAKQHNVNPLLLKSVEKVNAMQIEKPIEFLQKEYGSLSGLKIMIWGLAFKPDTDDVRQSPAIKIIERLIKYKADVYAYDPVAIDNAKSALGKISKHVRFLKDKYHSIKLVDALILITDWDEFKDPDFKYMKGKVIFDGRNIWKRDVVLKYARNYSRIG